MKPPFSFVAGLIAAILAGGTAPGRDFPATSAVEPGRLQVKAPELDPAKIRFTPPPAPKPAPDILFEKKSVVRKATHTLTLGIGEPSTLPDIPPRSARRAGTDAPAVLPTEKRGFLIGLSVTVYADDDRSPLTHLRWRDPRTLDDLEAWCAWDWRLLGPMMEVEGGETNDHLLFSPQVIDLQKPVAGGKRPSIPDHPALEADGFAITAGDPDAPAGRELLDAVRRYLVANREQLAEIRAAQERARAEKTAWEAANPRQPHDYTIVLRPHRGSRYLENREGKEEQ